MTDNITNPSATIWRKLNYVLAAAALAVACLYFLWRGPWRALDEGTLDLHVYYCSSRAWLLGLDPYDRQTLDAIFRQAGGRHRVNLPIALPTSLAPMAPLAMMTSWPAAEKTWTALNLAMTGLCLWGLVDLLALRMRRPKALYLAAMVLALAPFHTTFSQGQLSILVCVLVVFALRFHLGGRAGLEGIFIGLATALKPQMGLLLMVMLLARGRWRAVVWSVVVCVGLGAVAAGRMALAGVHWLPTLTDNLRQFTQSGTGDPSHAESYKMINLQVVLGQTMGQPLLTNLVVAALVTAVAMATVLALRGRRDRRSELVMYCVFGVLGLVAFYNRFYNATLLVLPLALAIDSISTRQLRLVSMLVLLLVGAFLVPGAAMVAQWLGPEARSLPGARLVLYHQVFLLAMLAVALGCFAVQAPKAPLPDNAPADNGES